MKVHTNRFLSMLLAVMMIIASAVPYTAYAGETGYNVLYYDAQDNGIQSQSTTGSAIDAVNPATTGSGIGAQLEDGDYTIDVYGWHETSDNASMMASALDRNGKLNVEGGKLTATIRFIKTTIMGMPVNGNSIPEIWPEPEETPVEGTGIQGEYDETDESMTYTFELSTIDYPKLSVLVAPMGNAIMTIRLKFDEGTLEEITDDYSFGSEETSLRAGTYNVPVALKKSTDITQPSMAASCLDPAAILKVEEGGTASITVDLHSVTIGPITAYAEDFKIYQTNGTSGETVEAQVLETQTVDGKEYPAAISFTVPDNSWDGVYISMWVDVMQMAPDAYIAIDYPEVAAGSIVETKEGTARVMQFGKYDVKAIVTIENGVIINLEIEGSGYDGTYADYNPIVLQTAVDGITPSFIGLSATDQDAIDAIDVVSGATTSSNTIKKAVMNALGLEEDEVIINLPEQVPEEGEYEVTISYITGVVEHSLVETRTNTAKIRVDDNENMYMTVDPISGTAREPLYFLDFNGYYVNNDLEGELTIEGVAAETSKVREESEDTEYTVISRLTFPLQGLAKTYNTNTYLYVPAMKALNGEISGIVFDNGKFNVDSFVTVYWDSLKLIEDGDEDVEITGFETINVDGGKTDLPRYADAAAVTAYLNENHNSVTANNGAVSIPVTDWTDTGGYRADTAGSYTFTAVLGDIPEGYKLREGVTATAEIMVNPVGTSAYVPGIYSGIGTGIDFGADPGIKVYVQTSDTEIVRVFALPNNQTPSFFNMALNNIAPQIINKQEVNDVDVVSGATFSSNGIIEGAAKALQNAENGIKAEPEEILAVPAVIWKETSDQASMMNGMLVPTADVRKYGSEYTAVIQFTPASIYGIPVNGNDAQNIWTASKTGEFTVAPVTEHYDEQSQVKTLELWLNAMKDPLPVKLYVVPMGSDQIVRLKLTFGVEKDKLEAAIAAADVKYEDRDLYTEESFAPFEAALNSAKTVFEDENSTQEQVDAFEAALKNAYANLVLKPRDRTANTLDELIDYAKNAVNGDIIRLGADISADADAEQSTSKRLIETKVDLTIEGRGHTLDGQHKFGFFYVRSGTLTINNIIIINSEVNPDGKPQAGPSIYVPSSSGNTGSLKLTNSIITGSLAFNGGIYVGSGNIEMKGCALIGSSARTGSNIYIDKNATGLLENNIIIGSVPVLEDTNSDVNFGAAGGTVILGQNNIIGLIYSGYLPANADSTSIILGNFREDDYTSASWAAFKNAWEQASVISHNWGVIYSSVDALREAISALEENDDEGLENGTYLVPLRIVKAADDTEDSMANGALDGPANVTIKDGKSTIDITMKGLEFNGQKGHLLKLWNYTGTELGDYEKDIIEAEVIETFEDEGIDGKTGTFPRVFRIERPATEEEGFYIRVSADAMAGYDQDARLVFDYANAVKEGEEPVEPGDETDPDKEPEKTIDSDGGEVVLGSDTVAGLNDVDNIGINFKEEDKSVLSINAPVSVIRKLLENKEDWELKIVKSDTSSEDVSEVKNILPERGEIAGTVDISAGMVKSGENPVEITDFSDKIKVTITLTQEQAAQLDSKADIRLYWYDKANNNLVDMNAVFDLDAGEVYFYTDHFSTYVIAGIKAEPGESGGTTPGGKKDGIYNVSYEALQESSSQKSMTNQFIKERATIEISGSKIYVRLVWHGTTSSPESSDGIHMTSIKKLQYLDSSGNYKNVSKSLDKNEDKLEISFTVNSISSPVYMRVQADEMGSDWKVFRLMFDESSMKSGEARTIKGNVIAEQYTIKATAAEGGTITPNGDVKVEKGKTQKFTVRANKGYVIKDVLVNGESVGALEEYTFEDVSKDAAIEARFQSTGAVPVFDDVTGHWAEKYIQIAVEKGLFEGTGENEFSPDVPVTRGMFVTVLGRLHGIDAEQYGANKFADVDVDMYYAAYIAWAAENSIVSGTGDGKFAPDTQISREEAALIIDRYITYGGIDLNTAALSEETTDVGDGSLAVGKEYAVDTSAMQESKEDKSMADQFLTEPAVLTVERDKIKVAMTWHGTEFITMDMLKELKLQGAGGELTEVDRRFGEKSNTLVINFETETIEEASIFQVYVPEGMGEMRPKFRLVFDKSTLKEIQEQAGTTGFADEQIISPWSRESVEKMKNAGILAGKTGNMFDPKGTATRAEAATIFVKLMGWDE